MSRRSRAARAGERLAAAAALIVVIVLDCRVACADDASCDRPALTPLRHDEDYSFLRDPRCRTDPWDPIKYLVVNQSPPIHLTLGLDLRERYEYFDTFDWGRDPRGGAGYVIQRLMPYADAHFGPHLRLFTTLTSNLVWGRDPRPLDRDDLDLLEAFVALSFDSFTLRAGRQEIQYASSRLVSMREGPNVRLAFDGVRVMQRVGAWQIDGLAVVPVEVRPGVFDDRAERGQSFGGVYATGPVLSRWLGLDAYYLARFRATAAFEQATASEVRHTFGARIWGEAAGFDYNTELVYQLGKFGSGGLGAWMAASDTGYTIKRFPMSPRFGLQANAASGDADPRSKRLGTFNPLFPRGAYFSQANLIGPLNLVDVHPALTLRPTERLSITLDWDFFWRQSLGDGLYLPSTVLQVTGSGNPARYVGSQGAALVQWQATRHASFAATYSHFFAGPFFRFAGIQRDVDFGAMWFNYAI